MDIIIKQETIKILTISNANAIPRAGDKILVCGYMLTVNEVIWHMDPPTAWVEVQVK